MIRFLPLLLVLLAPDATRAGTPVDCAGPFAVGLRQLVLIDPQRPARNLTVRVNYPALTGGSNAALIEGCRFPILSFGHGFTIPADRYQFLVQALVPLGIVVALPETETGLSPSHAAFAADLAVTPRLLRRHPDLAAVVGSAVAVGGHSMGGGAAVLAAASDRALLLLIGLAPANTSPSAITAALAVRQPTLLLTGSRDCVTPTASHAGPIFANLATPEALRQMTDIDGGSHCQFSDGYFTCAFGESSCGGSATIAAGVQHQQAVAELLPWLQDLAADVLFRDDLEG